MARKAEKLYEVILRSNDGFLIGTEVSVAEEYWDCLAVICTAAERRLESRGYDLTGFCFHSLRGIKC